MGSFIPIEARLKKKGFSIIAGIDEAGRGPLAGPVVSAAVILKPYAKLPGLDDSKKLSAKTRDRLFELVLRNCIDYSITAVPPKIIDQYNILNAVRFANDICISSLKVTPDIALIDGRDKQILDIPFQTIIKGDSRVRSIAAASILAKVFRDRVMEKYHQEFPQYNFAQHKGYGTRMHRELMHKHGRCSLHRKSFKLK
jgi:ribonuclease HII